MAVWGMGALAGAFYGLADDYRFRRHGVQTTGVFDRHTGVAGERNDRGVLSYSANGQRYHLTSLQGNGIYKLGDTTKLYYLPNNPADVREASYLPFDLLWLFLGIAALALSILGERIAKRLWH